MKNASLSKKIIFYICLSIFIIGIIGGMVVILRELNLEATITILMFLITTVFIKWRIKHEEKR